MSRRDNPMRRCRRCRMHASLCLCACIPRLETRTHVVLFLHRREDLRSTNTGRLATECLTNSEVHVRGFASRPTPPFVCDPGRQPLLLFPYPDAVPLTEWKDCARPITLVVPDGNWRQGAKVRNRVQGLCDVPRVTLPPGPASSYRLRAEPHPEGLSTMEAIARALGILEGESVQRALEAAFRLMIERTLWSRGELPTDRVTGGIPEGVLRHDPQSGTHTPPDAPFASWREAVDDPRRMNK